MEDSKLSINEIKVEGYEKVVEFKNEKAHLHAIIAIHNTTLGPACGGIRVYPYSTFDQALNDVLRLSKGMTLKGAVAQTGTGGGKSVLIVDKEGKTKEMLLAFAEAINYFNGRYFGGEDMGMRLEDLELISQRTPYVAGLDRPRSSGDPSLFTARGGFRGIQAVCQKVWGAPSVRGKKIAVQGLGSVGMKLIQHLFWEGAELIVTDTNPSLIEHAVMQWGAKSVAPEEIYHVDCDIFSPCAIGAILNEKTIPLLRCRAIAGVANNQLLAEEDGARLLKRKILYAPDFVINAGGLINISSEIAKKKYEPQIAREKVDHLYDLLLSIFDASEKSSKTPHQIAVEIAEHNLELGGNQ
jgi:leucine dehydrogenase